MTIADLFGPQPSSLFDALFAPAPRQTQVRLAAVLGNDELHLLRDEQNVMIYTIEMLGSGEADELAGSELLFGEEAVLAARSLLTHEDAVQRLLALAFLAQRLSSEAFNLL